MSFPFQVLHSIKPIKSIPFNSVLVVSHAKSHTQRRLKALEQTKMEKKTWKKEPTVPQEQQGATVARKKPGATRPSRHNESQKTVWSWNIPLLVLKTKGCIQCYCQFLLSFFPPFFLFFFLLGMLFISACNATFTFYCSACEQLLNSWIYLLEQTSASTPPRKIFWLKQPCYWPC